MQIQPEDQSASKLSIQAHQLLIEQITSTLKKLEASISKNNQQQTIIKYLNKIEYSLSNINLKFVKKLDVFIEQVLKPTAQEITNFSITKIAQNKGLPSSVYITILNSLKSILKQELKLYCQLFLNFQSLSSLQNLKQLLRRDCYLFSIQYNKANAAAPPKQIIPIQQSKKQAFEQVQEKKKLKYAKARLGYTKYHASCCELVFTQFRNVLPIITQFKLQIISSYLNLLYFLQDYIFDQEIYNIAFEVYNQIKSNIVNNKQSVNHKKPANNKQSVNNKQPVNNKKPVKQVIKQASFQIFDSISTSLLRLLNFYSNKDLKIQITLMGPDFCFNLLGIEKDQQQTVEVKLFAIKMIQKFSYNFYFKYNQFVKDEAFALYLVKQNIFAFLCNRNIDIAILNSCQYTLKLILDKGKLQQNIFKNFLQLIWQARHDLRVMFFKYLDPMKIDFKYVRIMLDNFEKPRDNVDLYVQEYFLVLQLICRYGSYIQMQRTVDILFNILKQHYVKFYNWNVKKRSIDAFKYCFQKFADHSQAKIGLYIKKAQQFINEPNYFSLSISRAIFESQQKKASIVIQKAAKVLIEQRQIIECIIKHMQLKIQYKEELMSLLKSLLLKYKSYNQSSNLKISLQVMLQSKIYPQIFTELMTYYPITKCQQLFSIIKKLLIQTNHQIAFECLSSIFYKVNEKHLQILQAGYHKKKEYLVKIQPEQLVFTQDLLDILYTSRNQTVQQQCAELVAEIYMFFSDCYLQKGKQKSKAFMNHILIQLQSLSNHIQQSKKGTQSRLYYGILCLTKQVLSCTQIFGVGQLKAHNSLITTSMIKVKIWNNASYGDDVQKCYQKTVPSNMTLFQLLSKIGEKFKIGQHEIYLQEGNNQAISLKMNGYTLLQLGFTNYKQYCAYKTTKVKLKKQLLRIGSELNPKFLRILKQMFAQFAKENKMGTQQIVVYIQSVTGSTSHIKDSRISLLLRDYDVDKDGYLTEQDFIRFYYDSCKDSQQTVWNNLQHRHYRKDLKKFNQPINPVEEKNLFRYYVKNSVKIYGLLFQLCKSNISQGIANISKNILVHLPTCENVLWQSIQYLDDLSLHTKSCFEISYIMINVRYFLEKEMQKQKNRRQKLKAKNLQLDNKINMEIQENSHKKQLLQCLMSDDQSSSVINFQHKIDEQQSINGENIIFQKELEEQFIKKFIRQRKDQKIFKLIKQLQKKQKDINQQKQQKSLKIVCISILRTLLNLNSLSQKHLIISLLKQSNPQLFLVQINQILTQMNQLNINDTNLMKKDKISEGGVGFFIVMAKQCLKNNDFTVFQSALAISLLNPNIDNHDHWIQQAIFHRQYNVRLIITNFLTLWTIKYKFSFNVFDLKVDYKQKDLAAYYLILQFTVLINKNLNFNKIFSQFLFTLSNQRQEIQDKAFNPVIGGNVTILKRICEHDSSYLTQDLYIIFQNLLNRTLSNQNRLVIYSFMCQTNSDKLLVFLKDLIKGTKATQKYQKKQNFVGIKNLGSTCYMNSILQQFFLIDSFKSLILSLNSQVEQPILLNNMLLIDDFLYQLQKMYIYLSESKKKYYNPKQFCLTIKDYQNKPINTSLQQDAHQFLNKIFFIVQEYLKKNKQNKLKQLQYTFQGQTICQITCGQCNHKKQKIQDFYHLALQVKDVSNLKQSFKKFILPQSIEDYFCQYCARKSSKITKQTLLHSCPQILIINLQRIIFDLQTFQRQKVHSKLQFPQFLSLQQFTCQQKKSFKTYKLKGVVIHSGTSEAGHYYSLIKRQNKWFRFNDQTVTSFNNVEMERQAFGGESTTDNWGQSVYSTNAYILFYQQDKPHSLPQTSTDTIIINQNPNKMHLSDQINDKLNFNNQKNEISVIQQKLIEQVHQQNKQFYLQLQMHQQSFFQFTNALYNMVRPTIQLQRVKQLNISFIQQWSKLPNLKYYEQLFDIYMQILKFILIYNNLKQNTMVSICMSIYQLFQILPEKTNIFFRQLIDPVTYAQYLIAHNGSNIREIYKVLLSKALYIYIRYYGLQYNSKQPEIQQLNQYEPNEFKLSKNKIQQIDQNKDYHIWIILQYLLAQSSTDLIGKNVFKSYFYFDFWRFHIQNDQQILQFCLQKGYLATLMDLLMGNQSFMCNDKKRQDFPYQISVPMVCSILKLLQRKHNLMGFNMFYQQVSKPLLALSQNEVKFLYSTSFYKKMMKFKYDGGMFNSVYQFICYRDKQFSEKITELFLIGLNRSDQVEDTNSLLCNIKSFLLIDDQLSRSRFEMMLGLPQLQPIRHPQNNYGLSYHKQSNYLIYASSRYFICEPTYMPALQVLYEKRSYFTSFQAQGIMILLQILTLSDKALKYVMSLPPPCYLYENYTTWIFQYFKKLKNQEHPGLGLDNKIVIQKMNYLLGLLNQQVAALSIQFPVQKYIIGLNANVSVQQQIDNQVFRIEKINHQTYVLENLPSKTQIDNLSLPDQIFKTGQVKDYAKYFIYRKKQDFCSVIIPSKYTISSIKIKCQLPLVLKFRLQNFHHTIYLLKGIHSINHPYTQLTFDKYLQIQVLNDIVQGNQPKMNKIVQQGEIVEKMELEQHNHWGNPAAPDNDAAYFANTNAFQIQCPKCTLINVGRETCQLCDASLFKD